MIHYLLPIVPLTVAGAFFFRSPILAYGFPVALVALKALFTVPDPVYLFCGLALLAGTFLIRRMKSAGGSSWGGFFLYSVTAVAAYEILSNLGVWIIGGCLAENAPLYAANLSGLADCYRNALPFTTAAFLRDLPLAMLALKAASWLMKRAGVEAERPETLRHAGSR